MNFLHLLLISETYHRPGDPSTLAKTVKTFNTERKMLVKYVLLCSDKTCNQRRWKVRGEGG